MFNKPAGAELAAIDSARGGLFLSRGAAAEALKQHRARMQQALCQPSGHDRYALASRAECLLIRACARLGIDPAIIALLQSRAIVRYAGHMVGERLLPQHEPQLAADIARTLADVDAAAGYGALAAGADILFAEALLARGAELNVILPFPPEAFRRMSVNPFEGGRWIARFERCLALADSIVVATHGSLPHALPFRCATELASGAAVLRAKALGAPVILTAVWDGNARGALGGTAEDIRVWSRLGLPQRLLRPEGPRRRP